MRYDHTVEKTLRDLEKLRKGASQQFIRAQEEATEVVADRCRADVPKLTGTLERSIHATKAARVGTHIVTTVVAGEPGSGAEDYALIVHEDPYPQHPNGDWKYIERPLYDAVPTLPGDIAARVDLKAAL